jgi:uncharacterized protein (TIGR03067 family)
VVHFVDKINASNVSAKGYSMKTLCVFLIAAGIILAAGPSNADPSKNDLDKLRGTWLTVSLVNDGKTLVDEKTPPKSGPVTSLVYEGTRWLVKVDGKTVASGVFTVDATKKPKEIDILDETGEKNDKTKLGIYEISGDTYKYCLASAGKPRPKDFTSKEGSGDSLGVMKREKR